VIKGISKQMICNYLVQLVRMKRQRALEEEDEHGKEGWDLAAGGQSTDFHSKF
jgi:hypothetical protein